MPRPPLRFGILCNGRTLAKWQALAIRALVANGNAVPVLLIIDDRAPGKSSTLTRLRRLLFERNQLWKIYTALNEPPALESVDVSELHDIPELRCAVIRRGRFSEYFSAEDVERIRAYNLDFLLRFGFGILKGEILESARYGVWSFHHGDETKYRGGPPGFWEISKSDPLTGVILQRLTDRLDSGIVLKRGFFKTLNYSYSRNLNRILSDAAEWPATVAASIYSGALDVDSLLPSASNAPVYCAPTNSQMIRYCFVLSVNIVKRLFERTQREEWNVGAVRLSPSQAIAGGTLRNVVWYPRFRDGWVADPMVRVVDDKIHVLVERMRLDTNKGYIAATSFDGTRWNGERPVIDPGCHASYPYMFSFDGALYCVPETYEANEVRLYKCLSFPDSWELVGTLLRDIDAVDSTIFEHSGLWWLFCTTADASAHRLLIFYADSPLGPWLPHVRNPAKIDVRSSRPAGAPFTVDGVLYRPTQDSSRTYGGRITINRVRALSPSDFEEEHVAYLEPDPHDEYGQALHTLSFAGDYAVIDGKRMRMKLGL